MSGAWLGEDTPGQGWPEAGGGQEEDKAWQARCAELEESLARFRDQAHRIREILKEKVGDTGPQIPNSRRRSEIKLCPILYKSD